MHTYFSPTNEVLKSTGVSALMSIHEGHYSITYHNCGIRENSKKEGDCPHTEHMKFKLRVIGRYAQ